VGQKYPRHHHQAVHLIPLLSHREAFTKAMETGLRLPPSVTLLIVIVAVAFLLLFRGIAFRIIGRALRASWAVFARLFRPLAKPFARMLRFLRVTSKAPMAPQPTVVVESVVGLSVGALARAFASETEEAIKTNFDIKSIPIQRHKQFFCTWLAPLPTEHVSYNKTKAGADLENAKRFFAAEIPTGSNPLNLYDDIEAAFIVDLLKNTDRPCFYVLTEFKKPLIPM
jgi:hypothetical protein